MSFLPDSSEPGDNEPDIPNRPWPDDDDAEYSNVVLNLPSFLYLLGGRFVITIDRSKDLK
jgi:hypothetical protein